MNSTIIIIISAVVMGGILLIIDLIKGNKETTTSDAIIGVGLGMFGPSVYETFINATIILSGKEAPEGMNQYVSLICGFLLIVIGIYYRKNLKEKVHVLNMHGLIQRDISDASAIKDLKLADYKVKEQIIDFIPFFDNGKIDSKKNEFICNQIENDVIKFTARITDSVGCFTGMAPIPYTIYAGTFMENANINRYFEYDGRSGKKKYYELKKATRKQKKEGWPRLEVSFPNSINTNSTEIVLAISVSHTISEENLAQFTGKDIVKLQLQGAADNIIQSKEQLEEYTNVIYNCINTDIDNKYPALQKIHLVASIPSCVSVAIGKSVGLRTNRNVNIIAYHFIREANPVYKFGIYINGSNKGKYIER